MGLLLVAPWMQLLGVGIPLLGCVALFKKETTKASMSCFGKFYLDKEKDIAVHLDMEDMVLTYTIFITNHQSNNLINNFARKRFSY